MSTVEENNCSVRARNDQKNTMKTRFFTTKSITQTLVTGLLLLACNLTMAAPGGARQGDILGCLLTPAAEAEVGSPVVGILEQVLVDRGDSVKKGQVLARLLDDVERAAVSAASQRFENRADVAAAKAAYDFAQRKAERSEELLAQNFISSQARDQAVSEARVAAMRYAQAQEQRVVAREDLAVANAQLRQRSITAPFTGVVVERYLQAGARVEDKPVIKLVQLDPLHAEIVLPASRFGSLKTGQSAQVSPEMQGASAVTAKISRVDAVVDAASNTFRVRLTLPNPGHHIPSGLRCQVSFDAGPR